MADEVTEGASAPEKSESITLDQYVAEQREAREAEAQAAEQPAQEPEADDEIEAQPDTDEQDTQDTDTDADEEQELEAQDEELDAEQPDEATLEEETEQEVLEPVDPPHFWNKEGKEHFADLDPQTQAFILEQSSHAQAAVSRIQGEISQQVQDYQVTVSYTHLTLPTILLV